MGGPSQESAYVANWLPQHYPFTHSPGGNQSGYQPAAVQPSPLAPTWPADADRGGGTKTNQQAQEGKHELYSLFPTEKKKRNKKKNKLQQQVETQPAEKPEVRLSSTSPNNNTWKIL